MAERKQSGRQGEEEEVPAFFKNLGSGSPKPRQKFCGMFCPVEGSLENKTIDFDSLSVGRGSNKVVAKQKDVAHLGPDAPSVYSRQSGKGGEPSVDFGRKVEIRSATGKEALQNLNDKVGAHVCVCVCEGQLAPGWAAGGPDPSHPAVPCFCHLHVRAGSAFLGEVASLLEPPRQPSNVIRVLSAGVCVCSGRRAEEERSPCTHRHPPFPRPALRFGARERLFCFLGDFPGTTVAKCPTQLVNAAHGSRNAIVSKRASLSLHLQGPLPCGFLPGGARGTLPALLPGEERLQGDPGELDFGT